MEDHKYFSVETSSRNKINIPKIRTNSHELHRETGSWSIPKTPWAERVCHLCESMRVEDENHFLLECLVYTHIRYEFHPRLEQTLMNSIEKQGVGLFLKLHGRKGLSFVWVYEHWGWKSLSLRVPCLHPEFHSICYNINLYNLLTCQNYIELGKILGKILNILKWIKKIIIINFLL